MKTLIGVVVVVVVLAVVESNYCGTGMHGHHDDPSTCHHTCPANEMRACEYGICTCMTRPKVCNQRSDCDSCPMDHDAYGNDVQQEGHCVDNACECRHTHHHHIGPIDLTNLKGPIDLTNLKGPIDLTNLKAPIDLSNIPTMMTNLMRPHHPHFGPDPFGPDPIGPIDTSITNLMNGGVPGNP